MNQVYTVGLRAIAEEHNLTVLHAASDYDTAQISSQDINRPGLQFAGFYDYFDPARIQIMGKVETTFLSGMLRAERERASTCLCPRVQPPWYCPRLKPMPELMEAAKKHDVTLLASDLDTSEFMGQLIVSLRRHLAPRVTLHAF
jgi:HPr kinase/phosphorylase